MGREFFRFLLCIPFVVSLFIIGCSSDDADTQRTSTQRASADSADPASASGASHSVATTEAVSVQQPAPQSNTEPAAMVATAAVAAEVASPDVAEDSSTEAAAEPQEHVVQAVVTQWRPLVLFAHVGDTVRFTTMAGHDTEAIEGMIPEGAEVWKSALGEEGFSITLEKEGAYIYKCNPHITTGMVGAIVVGDSEPKNLAALEAGLSNVKVGANMVKRTLRKMRKALDERG